MQTKLPVLHKVPSRTAPPNEGSFVTKQKYAQKRIAIAAEALTTAANVVVPTIPKTEEIRTLIGEQLWPDKLNVRPVP